MRIMAEEGLTLVELLMAIAIFGLIAAGATTLLSASLGAQAQGEARYKLYQEGLIIMERLTNEVKTTTLLHIPNHYPPPPATPLPRTILALSANINEDSDNYFNDPLFPRIDEDSNGKFFTPGGGIPGLDDDGDGLVDNGIGPGDDDEDGVADEEILNGLDDDGDGNVDEDLGADHNKDGKPGIAGMDDDGDGTVDEMSNPTLLDDDDEDGTIDEDPPNLILYSFDAPNTTLYKVTPHPVQGMTGAVYATISERVTFFQTTYLDPDKILIELTLTGADGATAAFSEYASPRNRYQKTGKRVR